MKDSSGGSQSLYITEDQLLTLLDAMSMFTKHENQTEMSNMLGEWWKSERDEQ